APFGNPCRSRIPSRSLSSFPWRGRRLSRRAWFRRLRLYTGRNRVTTWRLSRLDGARRRPCSLFPDGPLSKSPNCSRFLEGLDHEKCYVVSCALSVCPVNDFFV